MWLKGAILALLTGTSWTLNDQRTRTKLKLVWKKVFYYMQWWKTSTCLFLPLLLINRSMKLNKVSLFSLFYYSVIGATLVLTRGDRLNLEETNDTGRRERTVSPGSSLKLHCCLIHEEAGRCQVSWHFEPSGKNLTERAKKNPLCNRTILEKCNDMCDNMSCILSNISESDIGWYYCKVTIEIPRLKQLQSNKTKVIGKYCLSLQN